MFVTSGANAETAAERMQESVRSAEAKKLTCDDCRDKLYCLESGRKYICTSFKYFEWSDTRSTTKSSKGKESSERNYKGKNKGR